METTPETVPGGTQHQHSCEATVVREQPETAPINMGALAPGQEHPGLWRASSSLRGPMAEPGPEDQVAGFGVIQAVWQTVMAQAPLAPDS